ncbi:DUF5685 family protein [Nocardia jejuensis]|uniref:DUF5685 family protein n=1 Tax=Nocardia jejuensis TaxID=328049 RepID=UPI00082A4BB7|nr:DUF5685 family protein [Nocardia jejuensis]
MFGLLKPCSHSAASYGIDPATWQTHMCGLCLGLRDGHGQTARAATNTDALLLGVLTEAQQSGPAARDTAAPCPLRGMRRASVAPANSPGVQLAATASLLLGAAKIRDHLDDGDTSRMARRPLARVSTRWYTRARAAAGPIGLDIEPLIAAIESQVALERAALAGSLGAATASSVTVPSRPGALELPSAPTAVADEFRSAEATLAHSTSARGLPGDDAAQRRALLDSLTAPTQVCAAELFAHTAILADRPENAAALREAGWHFGRIAHLADAIEDLDQDRAAGKFNPLTVTGTTVEEAHSVLRESNSMLRAALIRVGLQRAATVRWMLLDPLNAVVRKLGRAAGVVHSCTTHACGSHRPATDLPMSHLDTADTRDIVATVGVRNAPDVGISLGTGTDASPDFGKGAGASTRRVIGSATPAHGFRSFVPLDAVRIAGITTAVTAVHGTEPPRTPSRGPGIVEGIGIILTQYCTGYACCAEHTRPCSGERKGPWAQRLGCDCDGCENACDCDCNCCDGCDCCDGCCCDGCGCDC